MLNRLQKEIKILPGVCDNTAKLGVASIFSMFMDLASEHAPMLGLGMDTLGEQGLFWLTVRTKIRIYDRPAMIDVVTADTWPEKPGRVRCNRYYVLSKDGKSLVEGKTEWAIIHMESGRLTKIADVYPAELEHCQDTVCDGPFVRIAEDFDGCEMMDTYRVRSTDIDLGQHMNNAAYARVILGALSCRQIEELDIAEMEIAFRTPCYEGDELTIKCREADGALEIGVIRADGKAAAVAKLTSAVRTTE